MLASLNGKKQSLSLHSAKITEDDILNNWDIPLTFFCAEFLSESFRIQYINNMFFTMIQL